jgi:hypothetical protein
VGGGDATGEVQDAGMANRKCVRCGLRETREGTKFPSLLCVSCDREAKYRDRGVTPYAKKFKKNNCEHCGFVALHSVQLDVDHIDGDSRNDDPSNLQTLCANCHRLKTHLSRDHLTWKDRPAGLGDSDPQYHLL